jgi:hypothetical protein
MVSPTSLTSISMKIVCKVLEAASYPSAVRDVAFERRNLFKNTVLTPPMQEPCLAAIEIEGERDLFAPRNPTLRQVECATRCSSPWLPAELKTPTGHGRNVDPQKAWQQSGHFFAAFREFASSVPSGFRTRPRRDEHPRSGPLSAAVRGRALRGHEKRKM